MKEQAKGGASRRDLLKIVGVGAPAAVATAAVGAASAETAADAPGQQAGLRKTEHVKKYLESARF